MDELIIGRLQFHSLNVISRTAKSNGQNNGTKGLASYLIGHQVPPVGLASISFFRLKKKKKKFTGTSRNAAATGSVGVRIISHVTLGTHPPGGSRGHVILMAASRKSVTLQLLDWWET